MTKRAVPTEPNELFPKWSFEGAQQRIGNGSQERALICSVANDKIKGLCSLVLVYGTSELVTFSAWSETILTSNS